MLERLKQWLGGTAEGAEPVASGGDDPDRETSTNAQTAGASDEPWPGNE